MSLSFSLKLVVHSLVIFCLLYFTVLFSFIHSLMLLSLLTSYEFLLTKFGDFCYFSFILIFCVEFSYFLRVGVSVSIIDNKLDIMDWILLSDMLCVYQ